MCTFYIVITSWNHEYLWQFIFQILWESWVDHMTICIRTYLGLNTAVCKRIFIHLKTNKDLRVTAKRYITAKKRSNEKLLIYCHIWPWKTVRKVSEKSESLFIYFMKTNSFFSSKVLTLGMNFLFIQRS